MPQLVEQIRRVGAPDDSDADFEVSLVGRQGRLQQQP